ncbi:MAG: hypothetical protein KGI70_00205 [Patescibacteria group bacterium]|nr:hypothetical protein [Patescibacteria group bacterium]
MYTRYITHMHTRTPHQRRNHALLVAGGLTILLALAWLATLPLRTASGTALDQGQQDASAAVGNATLIVPQDSSQ